MIGAATWPLWQTMHACWASTPLRMGGFWSCCLEWVGAQPVASALQAVQHLADPMQAALEPCWCVCSYEIHIVDSNPLSASANGWLEDTSKVEKYVMSDDSYSQRDNTYRKYKEMRRKVRMTSRKDWQIHRCCK